MLKNIESLPEVFLSDRDTSKAISRELKAGTIRKIGPKLYTRNIRDDAEAVVLRNLWQIVALLAPGTVVSHRTAIENRPAPDGSVFVTGGYQRNLALPGITIRQLAGKGSVQGDTPYMGSLHLASRPRSFLENLLPSRKRDQVLKTASIRSKMRSHIDRYCALDF